MIGIGRLSENGGGLTLLPHMCTCWVLVSGLSSAPWLMM
jgi:hypothetical protein